MNIESQSLNISATESRQKTSGSSSQNLSSEVNSFKDELKSIDNNEQKEEEMSTSISQNGSQSTGTAACQGSLQKVSAGANQGLNGDAKSFKDELNSSGGAETKGSKAEQYNEFGAVVANELSVDGVDILTPLNQLKSEIATIRDIKFNSLKSEKADKAESDTSFGMNVLKMDPNEALFFAQLVNGDNLNAQKLGIEPADSNIKTEVAQSAASVSAMLTDALSESMKTNKPFRIDFDKDIAVIMRVDREGKISAEFIPGDKAVEQYLRNNIPLLKERFEQQNLSYTDLSYQKHKQQQQQDNNRKQNKENDDE